MTAAGTDEVLAELEGAFEVGDETLAEYRKDGHVRIDGVLSDAAVSHYRPIIRDAFDARRPPARPAEQRDSYDRAFVQVINLAFEDPAVGGFTHARRFGSIAAQLMGAKGARVFVEDELFKEAGCDYTPWHQDYSAMPFDDAESVTLWIPLVDVTEQMGTLRFASGSHRAGVVPGPVDISADYHEQFEAAIRDGGYPIAERGALPVGSVSAHHGCTIHSAWPNETEQHRDVIAIHYFADGARIAQPDNSSRKRLLEAFAPHLGPADEAVSDAWPLVYRAD